MMLWLLCLFIKSIESFHSLNPLDLSCKKREYRLITDQSIYIITLDNPFATIHAAIGLDDEHISSLLTELWYEQINQQFVTLQSFWNIFTADGELNNIQSTIFNKPIDLLIRTNANDSCSYPNSSIDVAICCRLCSTNNTCPEIKILHEHSRYDIIVTNRGLMVPQSLKIFRGKFICSLFPSDQINRFSLTITNSMNIGQIPDKNDLSIIQHPYGKIENFFYYSLYPFHQWNKQTMNFNFIDILFIPYKQLAIFQLNECNEILCKIFLRVYEYKLNKTLQLNNQLYFPETIIETNVSSSIYFHLYFNILSNLFYLIGKQNIYASNNYGKKLIRIWTNDLSLNDSIILDPIMFSDTGHIAFIYRLNNESSCCYYFAIFSKAGLYYGWRTRIFRSSIQMTKPFFFDSSGSFYFNTLPPLLIILATEQSLVASTNLLVNDIPGRFFVRETDMNRLFVFCSLLLWDNGFDLIGSTLRFDKFGLIFIINIDRSSSQFGFCLQTSRLDSNPLQTFRQCQLTVHFSSKTKNYYLYLSGCIFSNEDQNSTIIISKFPNIFLDQIFNETFASGRIFQEIITNDIQKVEQILDRCLLKNLDENYRYSSLIYIRPTTMYSLANIDRLGYTKKFSFLTQNDYKFSDNNRYLIASFFDNRKSVIHQEFLPTQLSCYLPFTRTITFITKCLTNSLIQPRFEIHSNLSKLIPIEPPINFQLNRYQAGFKSVIVYNLDDDKAEIQFNSICDGFRNCSCILSLISHHSIPCAEHFYTIDSSVNNRIYMELWIENNIPNNKSIFLIEELSKRTDYELINNLWTNEMKENLRDLVTKNFDQLTENEIDIFNIFNNSLINEKYFFLGPKLNLKFLDEGLYHFRLTYLWGDQFCLTSIDLLILIISNTSTLTNYTFNYFLNCIFILILMFSLWIISVIFYQKILPKYSKKENVFHRRMINDNINFEILVKIREQSHQLLPYKDTII